MLPQRIRAVKNNTGPMRRFIILFLLLPCNTRLLLFGVFFYLTISPCHHCPQCPPLTVIPDGDSHWGEVSISGCCFSSLIVTFFSFFTSFDWNQTCTQNQKSFYVPHLIALRINPRFPKRLHSRPPALSIYLSCGLSAPMRRLLR